MAEEIEKLVTKIKSGVNLPNIRIGLFDIQGNILYSSLGEKASELASKLTKGAFAAWDIGDYQVKHLEKGCLLVSRVTEKLALAIDSFEREGLVIVTMGALMKRFAEDFDKIDKLLPGKPITVPLVEEKLVEPAPQQVEVTPEPIKQEPAPSIPTSTTTPFINITPDLIFAVSHANINKIEMDPVMLSLIRAFDGIKPVSEVVKLAGVEYNTALPRIIKLIENGILTMVPNLEEDNLTYHFVYELVPPYTVDNVAEKACAGRSEEVVTVMVNLDRGYTIRELSAGLAKIGYKKSPKEVHEILEYYKSINVTRIKQIGSGDISELLKNPSYQAIYSYTPGMNYEDAVKKVIIGDRKTLIILRNINLRRPVAEIYNGIRDLNIETTPEEVLKIFEDLEKRGIIKKI